MLLSTLVFAYERVSVQLRACSSAGEAVQKLLLKFGIWLALPLAWKKD
jgi:hypothetical protein